VGSSELRNSTGWSRACEGSMTTSTDCMFCCLLAACFEFVGYVYERNYFWEPMPPVSWGVSLALEAAAPFLWSASLTSVSCAVSLALEAAARFV